MPRSKLALPIVLVLAVAGAVALLLQRGSSDTAVVVRSGEGARGASPDAADPAALTRAAPDAVGSAERSVEADSPRSGPPAFTLHGRVIGLDGTPVAGVRVALGAKPPPFVVKNLFLDLGEKNAAALAPIALSEPSDATGAYALGVAQGASSAGWLAPSDAFLAARDVVQVDAAVEPTAPDLVVVAAGVIEGRVIDPDGNPVADARVKLEDEFNPIDWMSNTRRLHSGRASSDRDGRFRFESFPADVAALVSAEIDGHLPAVSPVRVAARATTTVELRLAKGATLSGRVITQGGGAAAGAKVTARQSEVKFQSSDMRTFDVSRVATTTAADGSFTIAGLSPGTYNLDARAAGFAPAKRSKVKVPEGGLVLDAPLELEVGQTIGGLVVDDTGTPVAHARLTFQRPIPFMPSGMPQSADAAEQMGGSTCEAGADGRFTSPPLKAGAYDVGADQDGLCGASKKAVKTGTADLKIEMTRRGGIEGIVLSREDGDPVVRFVAVASKPFELSAMMDPENFIPGTPRSVVSKDGKFSLIGLKPGKFDVEVVAPKFARTAVHSVEVKAGETTKGVVVLLPPEAAIRGRVVDFATGAPIANARITSLTSFNRMKPDPLERGTTTRSDATGAFEMSGLKDGRYELTADAKGYATGVADSVTVMEGQRVDGIDIRMRRGAAIEGKVLGKNHEPEKSAMVIATRIGDVMPKMTNTANDGTYKIEGLVAGSYSVSRMNQFELDEDNFLGSMFNGLATQTVKLKEGEIRRVDFDAAASTGSSIEGVVKDGKDPLPGAIIVFTPSGSDPLGGTAAPGEQFRMTTADQDGHFKVDNVAPGEWTATVQSGADFSKIQRETFDVTVPAQPVWHHDFELHSTGFEGTITARRDGKPVPGARVSVDAVDKNAVVDRFYRASGSTRMAEVVADQNGKYSVRGLKPGRYAVRAGGPSLLGLGSSGFARSAPLAAEVSDGEMESGVDFALDPGGTVVGTVTARGGGSVAGASLFFVPLAGREKIPFGETFSTSAGTYRCDGLTEGQYTVVAKAEGFAPAYKAGVLVQASGERTVDLELVEGANLVVTVTDATGRPVTSASVQLFDSKGTELSGLMTLDDILGARAMVAGTYDVGKLAPGTFTLIVTRNGVETKVEVTHGGLDQTVPITVQ